MDHQLIESIKTSPLYMASEEDMACFLTVINNIRERLRTNGALCAPPSDFGSDQSPLLGEILKLVTLEQVLLQTHL